MQLKPPADMQKINAKYFQDYRSAKKEDKDLKKNKFIITTSIDIPSKKQQFSNHQAKEKTKTIRKVLKIIVDKNKIVIKTFL